MTLGDPWGSMTLSTREMISLVVASPRVSRSEIEGADLIANSEAAYRFPATSTVSPRWHLDEMVVKINGRRMWLWRAVDDEGEVLDMLVHGEGRVVAGADRLN